MISERRGPSAAWYGAAGLLAVVASVIGVVIIVSGIVRYDERIEDFQRVPVPGGGELTFEDDGGYTAYFETPYACDEPCAPALSIEVIPVDGDQVVTVEDYEGTFTYSNDGRHGEAVSTLEVREPGRYRITVADISESGASGQLAVGRSVGRLIVDAVLIGIAVIATGVFLAGMAVLLVGLRRAGARAESDQPPAYT